MKKESNKKSIQKVVSEYINYEVLRGKKGEPLVTIQEIWISPRGDSVKIWLSFFTTTPDFNGKTFLEEEIKPHTWEIRKGIAEKLRHQVRYVPREVYFLLDETPQRAAYLDQLIEKVKEEEKAKAS